MLVGMLGILKAGGAYVPLDPEYPIDHLAFVLDDAHVSVLVIQQRFADRVPPTDSQPRRIIVIDVVAEDLGVTNLPSLSGPEDLAYVMYTSGSTGKPKGVMVTHRNLVHSTTARLTFYRDAVESFLLLPSFSFDASVAAIFWTLCTGGRLLLPEPGAERDPSAICRLIARRRASHVLCVCSLYHHIVERATTADLASIKVAVIGGEMCPPKLIAGHREKAPHALLFNEYGLTEGTVWSRACEVSRSSNDDIGSIGRPIPNTKIYILDSELAPVPIGVPGELYIGGDGVARGYLNRVDLTSARFVPDPFASRPGARLYKTGDVAQYHEDGHIRLLGRIDHQVKIRGRRVEPGEIEAVLALHQSVRRAFVTVLEESRDSARLVAYVVAQTDQGLTARDLRRFLSRKLPDFMVPAEFVVLDSLPMTPTGKVDRHALSAQRAARPRIAGDVNALRPLEAQLRHLWEELLEVGPIAVSDNFFELGGHSLLAVELITRFEMLTGTELSLTSLLEAPTVRQFADHVARARRKTALTLVPLRPDGFRPPFFCVHALNGTALTYEPLARHLGPDQPVYALQAVGLDGTHRPDCRVEEMAGALPP
jgi:amino acid adenylation domain-containing protein